MTWQRVEDIARIDDLVNSDLLSVNKLFSLLQGYIRPEKVVYDSFGYTIEGVLGVGSGVSEACVMYTPLFNNPGDTSCGYVSFVSSLLRKNDNEYRSRRERLELVVKDALPVSFEFKDVVLPRACTVVTTSRVQRSVRHSSRHRKVSRSFNRSDRRLLPWPLSYLPVTADTLPNSAFFSEDGHMIFSDVGDKERKGSCVYTT